MPRVQKIKRLVNALLSQQRLIAHLECGHNLSVTSHEIEASGLGLQHFLSSDVALCQYCPDLPPEPIQRTKSARQLWMEAGEP